MVASTSSVNGDLRAADRRPSALAFNAAGTQFASLYQAPAETGRVGGNRMAAKVAIIIASAVALTPAIGALAWQGRSGVTVNRSVELSGPIIGFTQSRERIQVRLVPAGERERRSEVVVRSIAGNSMQSIPLKHGQTWASAKLSAELANADALKISVE